MRKPAGCAGSPSHASAAGKRRHPGSTAPRFTSFHLVWLWETARLAMASNRAGTCLAMRCALSPPRLSLLASRIARTATVSTIVSGGISGETETLPIFVQKQFDAFNEPGAYGASLLLALLALMTLLAMNLLKRKEDA